MRRISLLLGVHRSVTYLIPIPPWESLTPDIHVRILSPFFDGRFMGFVLPVLAPQTPGVCCADEEGGDDDVDG